MASKKTTEKATVSVADLQALRAQLEQEAAEKQVELAQRTYEVDFETVENITRVLKHLNQDVTWNMKNAAVLINLSDSLHEEKNRISAEQKVNKETPATVVLRQVDINTLYQSLTAVQSTGIESARLYVRLLTNIGAQITTAMQAMATANQEIQSLHVELAELDAKIDQEETPTELVNNEAIEQV
jgi:hypothetical protein